MKQLFWLSISILAVSACTEKLVTPGGCPELCPGGEVVVIDTVLTPTLGGDTSYVGYSGKTSAPFLPISAGGALGDRRAVIRFIPRGDSLDISDTTYNFTVDSATISFVVSARDTTVGGLSLELYRLPDDTDSTVTHAEVVAAMTPDRLLRVVNIPDSLRSERFPVVFSGPDLDKFAPDIAGSNPALVVGIKLVGPTGAGAYIGGSSSGGATPLYLSNVDIGVADTAIQKQVIQRSVRQNFTVNDLPAPSTIDLLPLGGSEAARPTIRFELPEVLRDSAAILRATLELVSEIPPLGIPGDSVEVIAQVVLSDLGAKAPVAAEPSTRFWVHSGADTVRIELAPLAVRWQGPDAIQPIVRLSLGNEHGTHMKFLFKSSRSGSGQPRLRITYRPPFAVEGF